MKKLMYFFLFIVAVAVMNGCKKDDPEEQDPIINTGSQVDAMISGRVLDESNNPIQGAAVTAYGIAATTDQNGMFVLDGSINKDRCLIQITKAGYLERVHAIIPKSGQVNYIKVVLAAEPVVQYLSSSTGGTITAVGGASVQLPSNSFVIDGSTTSYSGQVSIKASLLSTSNANFTSMIPGGDLAGSNAGGDDVVLYSYGMMNVVMNGSGGEELQLAPGSTATITLPIASAQLGSAPATIPLWYFDEADGIWKEDGMATKVGNNYVGTVSHFSWWNYDIGYGRATINGRVVDCEDVPLANVTVTVNGQMTVVTDQNGNYTNWVPAGLALTFQVLPQGIILTASQVENVNPLTDGQTYTVPDLEVACGARIAGQITDCNGSPVPCTISISSNNILVNYCYSNDGTFSITGLPNTNYLMTIFASTGIISQSVTSPSVSNTLDVGTQQACNNVGESNSFTMDGIDYAISGNPFTSEGFYSAAQDVTHCTQTGGMSFIGQTNFFLEFSGNQPVSVDLSTTISDHNFGIYASSSVGYYVPAEGGSNHFILTVSEYGNVGDSIKGSFYGNMINLPDMDSVYVTNGKFSFLRKPDQ